jgi:hypothetical protein
MAMVNSDLPANKAKQTSFVMRNRALAAGNSSSDTFGGILNHSKIGAMEKKTHKELPGSCGWKNTDGDFEA